MDDFYKVYHIVMFNAKFARKITWQNNENVGLPFFYEEKSFRLKPIEMG